MRLKSLDSSPSHTRQGMNSIEFTTPQNGQYRVRREHSFRAQTFLRERFKLRKSRYVIDFTGKMISLNDCLARTSGDAL